MEMRNSNMKKWQIGAVAGALVFSLFATGCGEQIDQNAGIATSAPATEAPTEAATAAPELTERAKKLLAQNPDTVGMPCSSYSKCITKSNQFACRCNSSNLA